MSVLTETQKNELVMDCYDVYMANHYGGFSALLSPIFDENGLTDFEVALDECQWVFDGPNYEAHGWDNIPETGVSSRTTHEIVGLAEKLARETLYEIRPYLSWKMGNLRRMMKLDPQLQDYDPDDLRDTISDSVRDSQYEDSAGVVAAWAGVGEEYILYQVWMDQGCHHKGCYKLRSDSHKDVDHEFTIVEVTDTN